MSGEKLHKLDIGNTDKNWENKTQHGSIPDDNLFDALYEDENDGHETNEEDRCLI